MGSGLGSELSPHNTTPQLVIPEDPHIGREFCSKTTAPVPALSRTIQSCRAVLGHCQEKPKAGAELSCDFGALSSRSELWFWSPVQQTCTLLLALDVPQPSTDLEFHNSRPEIALFSDGNTRLALLVFGDMRSQACFKIPFLSFLS